MLQRAVAILDAFEIRPNTVGSNHEPGVVLVFDGRQCNFNLPALGSQVQLRRPDGSTINAQVVEIKEHGEGRSLFFAGLTRAEAPIGTVASWSDSGAAIATSAHAGATTTSAET